MTRHSNFCTCERRYTPSAATELSSMDRMHLPRGYAVRALQLQMKVIWGMVANIKSMGCLPYWCATILPERRSLASTIAQNSSEEMKRRNKPSSSAWSFHSKIMSAAPLIFKTRATASWRLQRRGMGPVLSFLPSTPRPKQISSPSLNVMNPGPDWLGTLGIIRKKYLT